MQFGGHHLGINATLDGASGTVTFATHLAPNRLSIRTTTAPRSSRLLACSTAFAFYDSLTDHQLAALSGEQVIDLVCAPAIPATTHGNRAKGSDLTVAQKQLVLDVSVALGRTLDEETTASALAKIEATLDKTYICSTH